MTPQDAAGAADGELLGWFRAGDDRKAVEEQLLALAKELVDLDVKSLEHRVAVLQTELATAKDDLAKLRDNLDRTVKDRHEGLLEKARKKKP